MESIPVCWVHIHNIVKSPILAAFILVVGVVIVFIGHTYFKEYVAHIAKMHIEGGNVPSLFGWFSNMSSRCKSVAYWIVITMLLIIVMMILTIVPPVRIDIETHPKAIYSEEPQFPHKPQPSQMLQPGGETQSSHQKQEEKVTPVKKTQRQRQAEASEVKQWPDENYNK